MTALQIEGEAALRNFPHTDFIADMQLMKLGSQLTLGDELEKNFELQLVRRRHDGISALDQAITVRHAQRSVLTRNEIELAARIEFDLPEIRGYLVALGDAGAVELVPAEGHTRCASQESLQTWMKFPRPRTNKKKTPRQHRGVSRNSLKESYANTSAVVHRQAPWD